MDDPVRKHAIDFLNNVRKNYHHIKEVMDSGVNPYELRNKAANYGYEMTPQQVKDALVILKEAMDIVRAENEY